MRHVLIALAVLTVVSLPGILRSLRRARAQTLRPPPDEPVEEHLSSCGRLKAVVFAYDSKVMRVEVFRLAADGEDLAGSWLRVARPSFVDNASLAGGVREALRAAGGGEGEQ